MQKVRSTHSTAGDQEVDDVMIKLRYVITYEQLVVFISGARVFLSHMHPQDRAHYPYNKSRNKQRNQSEQRKIMKKKKKTGKKSECLKSMFN